ncbi:restriction endonuclease S subunit [Vibrio metschnikovii]|uniref:restriction endonuclease subunit S n=1 Tax=Vibrio metschnikovii TaxID=28172 RepID=UPI0001B93A58|nr:restriction endonuclease subunit S [Vibrio metschnikovii]EEX38524.1 type I restriction-modification system specificity subunit S [Vibrio metschnikovii CIP 69.14]SUP46597.1 restriction endonuclease S subunit [Vibrio metschnikovii]SUQ10571.1 restriction endonuclease S subunit [Vibrio metschnikovii]
MSVENNVPEIRFKGFSGEWVEKPLNHEVELFSGLTYSPKDIRKQGVFVIRSSNVKNGQIVQADNVYVNPEVVNCSNVQKGDIIVVVRNGSRALIGKHAQVNSLMDNTVIGAFMTGVRAGHPEFINALFDTDKFTAQVEKNLGATINQITNGAFNGMVFMFPEGQEQTAIGNTFQKLDSLINQHQKKHDKLSNIKKAMLEKMFPKPGETTPEIRFKGFSGEWVEKPLNHEVELFSGLTYSPKDIRKQGVFVIRSSNVKNGQIVQADNVYVNPEVVNCSNVQKGDIIVVVRNGSRALIGKHAQVNSLMDNTVIGAFMTGVRAGHPEFINALFDTDKFTAQVEKNLGATINQITNGAFNGMVFMFPEGQEQTAIGNTFQKLDSLINQHQQQITKLNNIKQACLSKMFV